MGAPGRQRLGRLQESLCPVMVGGNQMISVPKEAGTPQRGWEGPSAGGWAQAGPLHGWGSEPIPGDGHCRAAPGVPV